MRLRIVQVRICTVHDGPNNAVIWERQSSDILFKINFYLPTDSVGLVQMQFRVSLLFSSQKQPVVIKENWQFGER
jgi:hypothetical protein